MVQRERDLTHPDLAQEFIAKATTRQLVFEITSKQSRLTCPLPDFQSFLTITVPDSFRVTSLGFSKNGVHVVDFRYLDSQNRVLSVPVVAKPLDREAFCCERAVYRRLQENPVLFPYFKPVFFVDRVDTFYLGTKAEPNSIPLSHLLKQMFFSENQSNRLLGAYQHIAKAGCLALLRLHALGILHEDWQPKNFGIDTRTGGVFAYDFEKSSVTENWTQSCEPDASIDEISNFLATCTFYALYGYLPDDLVAEDSDSPRQSRVKRKMLLRTLGLEESQFLFINESLLSLCKKYYIESQKRQTGWSAREYGFMQALLFQNMTL